MNVRDNLSNNNNNNNNNNKNNRREIAQKIKREKNREIANSIYIYIFFCSGLVQPSLYSLFSSS